MARKPRVEFEGAFYHVIVRGNQRQKVFSDDRDRLAYLERLGTLSRAFWVFGLRLRFDGQPHSSPGRDETSSALQDDAGATVHVYSKLTTVATAPLAIFFRGDSKRSFAIATNTCSS